MIELILRSLATRTTPAVTDAPGRRASHAEVLVSSWAWRATWRRANSVEVLVSSGVEIRKDGSPMPDPAVGPPFISDDYYPCEECSEPTEYGWFRYSGGLCGDCLAGYAVPLTGIRDW